MDYITPKKRDTFWLDRLTDEHEKDPHVAYTSRIDEKRELHKAVEEALANRDNDQIPRLWLKVVGNRVARERNYRIHNGLDALRFSLWTDHGVPPSEAFALSEEILVWIFSEIDPQSA